MQFMLVLYEEVYDDDAAGEWVRRSRAFAEELPAKKPRQKKG